MTTDLNSGSMLAKAEQSILVALGGRPWQASDLTDEALKDARREWLRLRYAAGFGGAGRWFTTGSTNPKMAKSGLPTVGVTMHASLHAFKVWRRLDTETRTAMADALDSTVDEVGRTLHTSVCPRSTPGCVSACVTSMSANSKLGRTDVARLTRTLLHLRRPASAFCLTGDGLRRLRADHGDACRWRVNVSDDIRWERLAPGLFTLGVRGYSYTKWSPQERPQFPGLAIVYSVTERMTAETVVQLVSEAHRAAVVFDVKPDRLPTEWNGVRVVDGNVTDDLWSHPPGAIVGLSAKAPTKALKAEMRRSGFARAV